MRALRPVLALLLLVSCGPFSGAVTGAQVWSTAISTFRSAAYVHVEGSATQASAKYSLVITLGPDGSATGGITAPAGPVQVLRIGATDYLSGAAAITQLTGLNSGALWVKGISNDLTLLLDKLADRRAFGQALADAGSDLSAPTAAPSAGTGAEQLKGRGLTATVSSGPTTRLLRVQTTAGIALSDGLSDVSLDFSDYGKAASIAPPDASRVADARDLNSFPARFQLQPDSFAFEGCDPNGCTLSTGVSNAGGRVGVATATFTVKQGTTVVGSCVVQIPPIDNKALERVGCRVNYDRTQQSSSGNVTISNPTL